jgi:stress response protein YsnF
VAVLRRDDAQALREYNDRLRFDLEQRDAEIGRLQARALAAEVEVQRLREELEHVCDVGDRAAVMVARAALERVGA